MLVMQNISIKHKLILITMLTCVAALLSVAAGFIVWEWTGLRRTMVQNLATQAEMVAENCKAALAFQDAKDAEKTLSALHVEPSIVFGCVYNKDGKFFATYYRDFAEIKIHPSKFMENGFSFGNGYLTVFRPIILDGEITGIVCLRSDLHLMYAMLKRNTFIIIAVLLFASLVAYLVSTKIQRIISSPILNLADVAKVISEKEDYSIRAIKQSNDELGLLIDSFNGMLEQIQQRDSALIDAKGQLEIKVRERTAELASSNTKLEQEVAERKLAQVKLQQHIKQLDCLYGLSKLAVQPQISLDQIFQETTGLIRSTYRYPDITCVRITFNGIQYKTDNFQKSELSQHADISVRGEKAGSVEVYCLEDGRESGEGPFFKEEGALLDAVAERLGRIAELKQATDKLRLFRTLIDQSNDCIFILEPKWGRFLDVNDRACESLGYSRKELLEMSIKDIEEFPDDFSWQQQIEELKLKGDITIQGRHKCKDGRRFFAETSLKFVKEEKEDYIIAIARDITERKRAEEKQAELLKEVESTNRELKDFAYIVSHDLKAPLRGVKTLAEWISTDYADKLDEQGKEQIRLLMGRADRMQKLIDGVLEYSRVGRVKENRAVLNLNKVVAEVIDMIAPPENIIITIENELPTIECELTRISQVFQNLLSNAVKYMDKPQGQVRIGCVEEDGFWKFSVSDNGLGIEEKYFEKIFQIFQTLAPRDNVESTGVGLTVAKKIVELYGGRIWVQSKVGQGSTFFFTLPKQEVGVGCAKLEANITC